MDQEDREKILTNLYHLVSGTVNFDQLLYRLTEKKVINDFMVKKIKGKEIMSEKLYCLYEMIPKRGPEAFKKLIDALHESGNNELAKRLKSNSDTRPTNFNLSNDTFFDHGLEADFYIRKMISVICYIYFSIILNLCLNIKINDSFIFAMKSLIYFVLNTNLFFYFFMGRHIKTGSTSEEVDATVSVQPNYVPQTDEITENKNAECLNGLRSITISPEGIYSVNSKPKGYIQVINISKWDNDVEDERIGSAEDVKTIERVLPKYGYIVSSEQNLDKEEFEKCVKTFCEDDRHKDVDSAILIIMSHGRQPVTTKGTNSPFYSQSVDILTRDNQRVSSDWVVEQFTSVNCSALAKKPKIVIFAACRGLDWDYGLAIQADGTSVVPRITNLLMVFPCLPDPELFTGNVSYRNAIGTWMIQEFISVLEKRWKEIDLETMLDEVSRNLKARHKIYGVYQVVNRNSLGFDKKFFFHQVPTVQNSSV